MWQKSWRQVETRFRCQPGRRLGKRGETRQLMLFCFLVGILAIPLSNYWPPFLHHWWLITNHQVEPRSLTLSSGGGGLQRKRSQSLADIQVRSPNIYLFDQYQICWSSHLFYPELFAVQFSLVLKYWNSGTSWFPKQGHPHDRIPAAQKVL